jgi:hypothetical protein
MKLRFAKLLLMLPSVLIDAISLPVVIINWLLTGNILTPLSQQISDQEDKTTPPF